MPAQTVPILPENCFNELVIGRHGPMLANRFDQYVGVSLRKYGEFSAGESEIFQKLVGQGTTVIEVGSNIGAHTVELSRLVGPAGRVLAFEPQRIVFQTLCANLALNGCANVYTYNEAVGETAGEIKVPFLPPDNPANFGGLSLHDATHGETVRLRALDELALDACHFLKLDLEGMELEALHGGATMIARHRPLMYVENDRPARAEDVIRQLLAWNYQLYWHTPRLFSEQNFAGDPENVFGEIVSINMLCIPAERNIVVHGLQQIVPASLLAR